MPRTLSAAALLLIAGVAFAQITQPPMVTPSAPATSASVPSGPPAVGGGGATGSTAPRQ